MAMASEALRARTTGSNSLSPMGRTDREYIDEIVESTYHRCVQAESLNPGFHVKPSNPDREARTVVKRPLNSGTKVVPDNPAPDNDPPTVFITYAPTAKKATVKDLADYLSRNGIEPSLDIYQEKLQTMNMNSWLNNNIENNKYVIACVDRGYREIAYSSSGTDETDDENQSYATFVFNQLQTEIIHNACNNCRIIPVLVDDAKFMDLPKTFQNTTVYRWPTEHQKLVDRIFQRQRYRAPPLGTPPPMVFETC